MRKHKNKVLKKKRDGIIIRNSLRKKEINYIGCLDKIEMNVDAVGMSYQEWFDTINEKFLEVMGVKVCQVSQAQN